MNCQTIKDNIIDYLENNLSESLKADMDKHVDECPWCRETVNQYMNIQKRLQDDGDFFKGNQVEQQLMAEVSEFDLGKTKSPQALFSKWFFSAAALILLCLGGIAFWNNAINITDSQCISITGQNQLFTGSHAAMNIQVKNWRKDKPVENAEVKLTLVSKSDKQKYDLGSFTTNSDGCLDNAFYIPELDSGKYTFVVSARSNYGKDRVEREITLQRPSQLYLTTDKPIYQPGQKIHIKCIARNSFSAKPLANRQAVIEVFDAKGTKVFKDISETSSFGITSADFQLATLVGLGNYKVRVTVDEIESEKTVLVDRYVLPKFKAELETDKSWYLPGQTVTLDLQSDYFFGKPVSEADVNITLTSMYDKPIVIHNLSGRTGKSGHYQCTFTLDKVFAGVPAAGGNAMVELNAEIVDSAGQSITKNITIPVSSNAINIVALPENGRLAPGIPNRVYILAAYPDGKPAECDMTVNGRTKRTDRTGLAICEIDGPLVPQNHDRYDVPEVLEVSLKISAKDSEGNSGSFEDKLYVNDYQNAIILRTDKAVYRGGQTVDVSVICAENNGFVYVDMIRGGQTILTKSVQVKDGIGKLAIDLPPHVFGTMKICAYKTGYWLQSRLIHVVRAESLDIKAKFDRSEYAPGQNAKVDFTVRDKDGKPTQAALGVAVVDEAVFYVSALRPGLLATYLDTDQEMLKPAYQIKYAVSRSDLLNPDYGNQELTKALFSGGLSRGRDGTALLMQSGIDNSELEFIRKQVSRKPELLEKYQEHYGNAINVIFGNREFSMISSTYDYKAFQHRKDVRELNETLWVVFWVVTIIAIIVMLVVVFGTSIISILVVLSIIALLISILMPALNKAKMQAIDAVVRSSLNASETALKFNDNDRALSGFMPRNNHSSKPVRVREYFPETLLFKPEIITDESGRATLDITMADSITNWKMAVDAIDTRGALGGNEFDIKVFQPFFVEPDLPVSLTRNDIISIPIACYNYLDHAQRIELKVADGDWFEFVGSDDASITLNAGEVRSIYITIKAVKVGLHKLTITANGEQFSDAVRRDVEVVSDGVPIEYLVNGTLSGKAAHSMTIPHNAIDSSQVLGLSIYPSRFSEVVDGLDNIFRKPHGCFEQTSSTTYPNIMALIYMQKTGQVSPEVQAKASEFINAGYQRLLTFEVDGGGFDWFGNPPASEVLTAFGIMEFCDMAKVHNVDPDVIERTCRWLAKQQHKDGYWNSGRGLETAYHIDDKMSTTAYVAWALASADRCQNSVANALNWLDTKQQQVEDNNYVLALTTNAALLYDKNSQRAQSLLRQLADKFEDDKNTAWLNGSGQSAVYSRGKSLNIETTALGTLALIESGRFPELAAKAQKWLSLQKDSFGTFQTTQATVLALKTLVAGYGKTLGEANDCNITVLVNGKAVDKVAVNDDNFDVVQLVDISRNISSGSNTIKLVSDSDVELSYKLAGKYYLPGIVSQEDQNDIELDIDVDYDRAKVELDAGIVCNVTVRNLSANYIDMAIVDLGIPPGFKPDRSAFDIMVKRNIISKYEITGRQVILYLRGLGRGPLEISYKLWAMYPVKIQAPPSSVWEYYNPENKAVSEPEKLEIFITQI